MNIAMLHCLKITSICTGASCLKAYNNSSHYFAEYPEKPTLCAFMHCGGCEIDRVNDPGMIEKMERLQTEGVKRVHIGKCVGMECDQRDDIVAMLERYGFEVVHGTH